jgi:surface carbohydrate biosynthesis protein
MNDDIITLISRDGKDKITCFKYMEEYFKKEGYTSSKKLYIINLLYKLSDFKILRKIKVFFTLCLRCKFFFQDPKHIELVIFDSENTTSVEKILPDKNYVIISTRIEQINKIYVSKKIIFYIIKNFFKCSLKQNYLTALIKIIAPKIVVTHISDSRDFHIVSKTLNNKIKFIAIQTYAPTAINTMFPGKDKKNFFIPKLFCYGKFDELFYKKKKVNIGSFEAVGSIKSSLAYEYTQSEKLKINPNKYDICLIAETLVCLNKSDHPQVKNLHDGCGLVAEFTHRLCRKHNLNTVISGKAAKDTVGARREIYFYKHYLKNYNFEIFHLPKEKREYSSYINIMQSKLTIALWSTILREAISFEKKILSFNPTGHPDVIFPGPSITFPQESICVLTKPSYELFEERVLKILSMTNKEYFSQLGKEKSFLMAPTVETASILRKRLKQILEYNANDNIK